MGDQPSDEILGKLQELADNEKIASQVYDTMGNSTEARASKFRADNWQQVVDNNKKGKK